ncbi:hypothetical protein PoB_006753900 [Plakobranchus ocellatus]|uniref:Uncharacterized protein n=1 Tax=Plakobranchus ocellatus TaxID=259542 RepID=A0AAV4D9Y2_9GAST|nr:hypothetical protein PoB_006753900 [Plakobranchus ocellatus]
MGAGRGEGAVEKVEKRAVKEDMRFKGLSREVGERSGGEEGCEMRKGEGKSKEMGVGDGQKGGVVSLVSIKILPSKFNNINDNNNNINNNNNNNNKNVP